MIDLFNVLINFMLALLLGYITINFLYINKKCCPYKLGFIVVIYFVILYNYVLTDYRMNSITFFKETFTLNNNNNNILVPKLNVQKDTFKKTEDNYYGTKIPIIGPLDGLPWQEVVRRVNYLKTKTQHPYKPITYTDYKTSMDELLGEDLSGLIKYTNLNTEENIQELKRWYPNSTINQINARDCTNYSSGHPLSCIQKPITLNDDLLLNNNDKIDLYKKENFASNDIYKSTQQLLNNNTIPTLFKNSPGYVGINVTRDISNDMCRGCVVGKCTKGVCGSRIIEQGNENILDVEGYIKSYLNDNVELSNEKEDKSVNPWTFF